MRRYIILALFMSVGSLWLWSCSDDPDGQPGQPVESPSPWFDSVKVGCCDTLYYFSKSITSAEKGLFHWLGITNTNTDSVLAKGEAVWVSDNYTDVWVSLSIRASYYVLTDGNYYINWYTSENYEDIGSAKKRSSEASYAGIISVGYAGATCTQCCSPGRLYATAGCKIDAIVGVKCKIAVKYGALCGGDNSTSKAASVVFCNISRPEPSATRGYVWGQTGYGLLRRKGETTVRHFRYGEIWADTQTLYQEFNDAPQADLSYLFEAGFDTDGYWTFGYDGQNAFPPPYAYNAETHWQGDKFGSQIMYSAETFNAEDILVGTANDLCVLTELGYKISGDVDYREFDASTANYSSSLLDLNVWYEDSQTIYIYDARNE